MQWFRLYHSVLRNPKIQRLPPADFKAWINLLIIASEHDPRGELPCLDDVAFLLRSRPEHVRATSRRLLACGLLERQAGKLLVHAWDRYQFASDDINQRVERHREKTRESSGNVPCNVTANTHVTAAESHSQRQKTDTHKSSDKSNCAAKPELATDSDDHKTLLGLLNLDVSRIPSNAKSTVDYLEKAYEMEGQPTEKRELAAWLDKKITFCSANGNTYPKAILLRLKQLQREVRCD